MISPRLRRLAADYQLMRDEFSGHPNIRIASVEGNPPDTYRIVYRLPGLALGPDERTPEIRRFHEATIHLTADYPREHPACTLTTPIFHPNFGSYICIGDYWAAGETLRDVVIKIGDMIQYRDYNVKSPLNAVAASWVRENEAHLPVGNIDLYSPDPDVTLSTDADVDAPAGPPPGPSEDDIDIEFLDGDTPPNKPGELDAIDIAFD